MMSFEEIDKSEIRQKYPTYFHEKARYFNIVKNNNNIGYYGVISYTNKVCEAFLMFKSFKGKVLSRDFFVYLFLLYPFTFYSGTSLFISFLLIYSSPRTTLSRENSAAVLLKPGTTNTISAR